MINLFVVIVVWSEEQVMAYFTAECLRLFVMARHFKVTLIMRDFS